MERADIRIPTKLKKQAQAYAKENGLSFSDVVRMALRKFILKR